jgi:Protein of unknown function (DUF2934)
MAKRPSARTQSQADDAAATVPPRPRGRRPRATTVDSVETIAGSPADAAIASSDPSESIDSSLSNGFGPSEEEIRIRAYHRYLERGGGHGMDFEDWLEAERELRTRK